MKLELSVSEDTLYASGDEVSSTEDLTKLCIPDDSLEDLCCIHDFTGLPPIPLDLESDATNHDPAVNSPVACPLSLVVPTRQRTHRGRRRLNWEFLYGFRPDPVSTDSNEQKAPRRKRRRWRTLHDGERSCMHCGTRDTPQWRMRRKGTGTLCNACGIRYSFGRLMPEYRPLGSPSCGNGNYSNRHKKIINIRKNKAPSKR